MKIFATRMGKLTILCIFALLGLGFLAPQQQHMHQGGIVGGMGDVAATVQTSCAVAATNPLDTISVGTLVSGFSIANLMTSLLITAFRGPLEALCGVFSSIATWADSESFIFSTGSGVTYNQPTVLKFYAVSQTIALAVMGLLFLLAGYEVMMGASVATVVPRIILATIAVLGSRPLVGYLIDLESAMCHYALFNAVFQSPGEQLNILNLFAAGTSGRLDLSGGIDWIGVFFIIVMGIGVSLQAIVRLGVLDLLIAIGPICLMCYGKRGWQRWGNLWMAAFFATLFVQFVQVVAIGIGSNLVGSLGGPTPVSLLAGIAILFLVLKIPGWMSNAVTNTLAGVPSVYEVVGNAVAEVGSAALRVAKFI